MKGKKNDQKLKADSVPIQQIFYEINRNVCKVLQVI
jgi:hypothetical protein